MSEVVAMGDSIDDSIADWTKFKKVQLRIGKVGSTGKSTGPHLHFEVRRPGKLKPPEPPPDPESPEAN